MPQTKRSWKTWAASGLLLALSLLLSALLAEGILRLLGYHGAPQLGITNTQYINDQNLNWRYIPNSETQIGKVVMRYNSAGFRDSEHSLQKPHGIRRLIVLGDSVTLGYGVVWESVFSHVLQVQMGNDHEVISLAMAGLNTPQEIHLFEQAGLAYEPDLVVLNFVLNDCDFYSNILNAKEYLKKVNSTIGLLNMKIDPQVKQRLKSSALIYFVKERLENFKGMLWGEESTDYFTDIWSKEENKDKVRLGFDKLQAMQRRHSFEVLVMIWPVLTSYSSYKFEHIHTWVQNEAEKRGFSTIDLLSRFSEYPYRKLQLTVEDNVHPNALGHKIGADTVIAWYKSNSLLESHAP